MVGVVGSSPIAPTKTFRGRHEDALSALRSPRRHASAFAQFPGARPITIIVPIPPGGAPDIAARVLAHKLSQNIGQPVFVENRVRRQRQHRRRARRAGAARRPHARPARRQPDHHQPACLPKMPFDTLKDLLPVASVASNQFVLAVNPGAAGEDLAGVHRIREEGQPAARLCLGRQRQPAPADMEMLKQRAGIDLLHVPYQGRRAGRDGDGRGRDRGGAGGQLQRAADQGRPAARARRHRREALARSSRTCRRSASSIPASRLDLARPVRSGGHSRGALVEARAPS